jgi:hypothetical protein
MQLDKNYVNAEIKLYKNLISVYNNHIDNLYNVNTTLLHEDASIQQLSNEHIVDNKIQPKKDKHQPDVLKSVKKKHNMDQHMNQHMDQQNIIWERIKKLQIAQNINQPEVSLQNSSMLKTPLNNTNHTNNLIMPKLPNTTVKTQTYKKNPPVNQLSKYTKKDQNKKTYEIYKQAKKNITILAIIDNSLNDNINNHIQIEADRLLKQYLSS